MPALSSPWIVETDWLAARLDAPDIVVVDASLHLPNTGRNARAEYLAEHIPGALFFDIEDIADEENPLPHMLPSTIKFASRVKRMGIGDGVRVIAYDSVGLYSAARAGGCSAPWATTTWRCSTAASRNGRRRGAR
jgi:thiosulfate/3-mercaptopyruvate sulfurtransferase